MLQTIAPQLGPALDAVLRLGVAGSAIMDVALVAGATHVLLGPGCALLRDPFG